MKKLIILFCFFGFFISHGQTTEEWEQMKQEIMKPENLVYRNYLNWRSEEFQRLKQQNSWPEIKISTAGDTLVLSDFDENEEPIYTPSPLSLSNSIVVQQAHADALHQGGSLGVNIEGQGMMMAMWEYHAVNSSAYVQDVHQDFLDPNNSSNSRVLLAPNIGLEPSLNSISYSSHATIVASTAASSDHYLLGRSEGIAPKSNVLSYSLSSQFSEAGNLMNHPVYGYSLASNHSWSYNAPLSLTYTYMSSYSFDRYTRLNPYHTAVLANGNSFLSPLALASQNALSVSALNSYGFSNGLTVNATCADTRYRVLPALSASTTGYHATYVPTNPSTSAYVNFQTAVYGTSFSAPQVAAGVLLLQQLYRDYNTHFMLSSTVRGLLIHSATDKGVAGPDLDFGYGQMNLEKAGEIIQNDGNSSVIIERSLNSSSEIEFQKVVKANTDGDPLEVTLTWDDPVGAESSYIITSLYDFLINDLDVRIYNAQGVLQNLPWTMNGVNSNIIKPAAVLGDNDKDTYEKIVINNPTPGELYTIKVTSKQPIRYRDYSINASNPPLLVGGSQNFSLIISGIVSCVSDITVTSPITTPVTHHAGTQLNCSSEISGSSLQNVNLYSGENVSLTDGFYAHNRSTHIDIRYCVPTGGQSLTANRYQPVERQIKYFKVQSNPEEPVVEQSTSEDDLKVYPNPTSADLTFELSEASSGKYEVRDALGRLIYVDEFEEARKVDIPLREKNLDGGTYFLLVSTPTHNFVRKFVVQ